MNQDLLSINGLFVCFHMSKRYIVQVLFNLLARNKLQPIPSSFLFATAHKLQNHPVQESQLQHKHLHLPVAYLTRISPWAQFLTFLIYLGRQQNQRRGCKAESKDNAIFRVTIEWIRSSCIELLECWISVWEVCLILVCMLIWYDFLMMQERVW